MGWPTLIAAGEVVAPPPAKGMSAPPPPLALVASWPFLRAPFSVYLPMSPSPTELLRVTCGPSAASTAFFTVVSAGTGPTCAPPYTGAVCVLVDSGSALSVSFFLAAGVPPSLSADRAATVGSVMCTVASSTAASAVAALPRFGLLSTLTAIAVALPATWPLIDAIIAEDRFVPNRFAPAAGLGAGAGLVWSLSAASVTPPNADPANATEAAACASILNLGTNATAAVNWRSPLLPLCTSALGALAGIAATAVARGGAPSLVVPLADATHFVLVSNAAAAPFSANLTVSLGGTPCRVHWVAPNGLLASVTTPPMSVLCASLGASPVESDCGVAQLVVSSSPWSTVAAAVLRAASTGSARRAAEGAPAAPLQMPSAYAPVLAGTDWASALDAARSDAQYAATATLPASSPFTPLVLIAPGTTGGLATAAALSLPGVGFRVFAPCTDDSFAPMEVCTALAGASYAVTTDARCAWGAGGSCSACPDGASCPGGDILLPLPGFWAPLASGSSPGDLVPCAGPDPVARCPGWRNVSTTGAGALAAMGCGRGYRGIGCVGCAPHYVSENGYCNKCPAVGADEAYAVSAPLLVFGAGLLATGAALLLSLCCCGCVEGLWLRRHGCASVGALFVWSWTAAQPVASVFSLIYAYAPPAVARFYVAFTALHFKGLTVDPACVNSTPFLPVYVAATAVGGVAVAILGVGVGAALGVGAGVQRGTGKVNAVDARKEKAAAGGVRAGVGAAEDVRAGVGSAKDVRAATIVDADDTTALAPRMAAVLRFALGFFVMAFGPITAAFSDAVACSANVLQPTRLYLGLTQDGTALAAALADDASAVSTALRAAGASATVADLVRAATDRAFSAARKLDAALKEKLAFSTLLADPSVVCFEGLHVAAGVASVIFGSVALLLIPFLLLATRERVAASANGACTKSCWVLVQLWERPASVAARRVLAEALGVRAAPGAPLPLLAPTGAWQPVAFTGVVAALNLCAAFAARAAGATYATAAMGGALAVALVYATAVYALRPFNTIPEHAISAAWRGPTTAAFALVAGVAAACTIGLARVGAGAGTGAGTGVGTGAGTAKAVATATILPLVLALATCAASLCAWWTAMVRASLAFRRKIVAGVVGGDARKGGAADGGAAGGGAADGGAADGGETVAPLIINPLRSAIGRGGRKAGAGGSAVGAVGGIAVAGNSNNGAAGAAEESSTIKASCGGPDNEEHTVEVTSPLAARRARDEKRVEDGNSRDLSHGAHLHGDQSHGAHLLGDQSHGAHLLGLFELLAREDGGNGGRDGSSDSDGVREDKLGERDFEGDASDCDSESRYSVDSAECERSIDSVHTDRGAEKKREASWTDWLSRG